MSLSSIDWGHLHISSGGETALEVELLSLFIQHTESQLLVLHRAWEIRDFMSLAQVAHQLRSSCGTIGAYVLYGLMTHLEIAAVLQKETDLEPLINALDPQFAQILEEIYQYNSRQNLLKS
jgi:HPt (histidine-containing phosphotransfer) domain-containing protein